MRFSRLSCWDSHDAHVRMLVGGPRSLWLCLFIVHSLFPPFLTLDNLTWPAFPFVDSFSSSHLLLRCLINFAFQILYFAIAESPLGFFFNNLYLFMIFFDETSFSYLLILSFDMLSFSSLSIFTRVDVKSLSHEFSVELPHGQLLLTTVFLDDRTYCPVSLRISYFLVLVEIISWKLWKSDSQPLQDLLFLLFVCLVSFLILYSLCSHWSLWLS